MKSSFNPNDFMRLPGPARFSRQVVADFEAGKSVVVVFPDTAVRSGLADALLDEVTASFPQRLYCVESMEPFPCRILDTFGADRLIDRDFYEWDTFIRWEAWHGQGVTIQAWEHPDVGTILERWPAQLVACGLSNHERPKLVIGVRLSDVSRTALHRLDRHTMSVHWWWGALDRLDTEFTLMSMPSAGDLNPVELAVISEVSSWDLNCAEYLLEHWDRATASIEQVVCDYRHDANVEALQIADSLRTTAGSSQPPADVEDNWNDGEIEWWGHGLKRGPAHLGPGDLRQRVWLAHNRTLMSHVDDERAQFEQKIIKAVPERLRTQYVRDDDIIEIGSLKRLVDQRVVFLSSGDRARLHSFWRLRNDLAHRNPVEDELLTEIFSYLKF